MYNRNLLFFDCLTSSQCLQFARKWRVREERHITRLGHFSASLICKRIHQLSSSVTTMMPFLFFLLVLLIKSCFPPFAKVLTIILFLEFILDHFCRYLRVLFHC